MTRQLKTLLKNNPKLLDDNEPDPDLGPRHFLFSIVDPGDPITMPVCGALQWARAKHKINDIDCPDCLAALEVYADADDYDQGLAHATTLLPRIINPDPEVMKQKMGPNPTIDASRHIQARQYLKSRAAVVPSDLPKRMIGGTPRAFFKNLLEVGLIDRDGERTGLSAQDLSDGKFPEIADKITED